jgi:coenzyme F420-0:L-glutamate ligase/coenzyme F420-1:gamma-L-glutamate ligase
MAKSVNIIGLESLPMVKHGDDLPKLILSAMQKEGVALEDGDIVVVAHKIVSKAEGRLVNLTEVEPSQEAVRLAKSTFKDPRFVDTILRETKRIVKATPEILIVENRQGWTCVNAGVDKSNVEGEDSYAILPKDPDESAKRIRSELAKLTGKKVSVIITDTYSRPFRRGQTEFAIGIAGINPFKDYRGRKDLAGHALRVKNTAVADEISSAAELVIGQGNEGAPIAIIKNLVSLERMETASFADLLISRKEDLFTGTL